MAGYIGRAPLSDAIQSRAKYTASAGQTSFSFAYQPGFVDVFLNGVKIEETVDYTATSGTDIVLTSGAIDGQVFEAVGLTTFSLINGKMNYSATSAPVVGDDSADGYRIGSMWIDITNDEVYRCVDDTIGAAVWIGTTLQTTDLGSLAMLNSVAAGQIDANAVNASELNVSGNGTSGQYLGSDGDGTFSWMTITADPTMGGDLSGTASNAQLKANVVTDTELNSAKLNSIADSANNYSLPSSVVHESEKGALHATDALRLSGHTVSLYKGDGTSESVTIPDNNTVYTHPSTHAISEVSGLQSALDAKTTPGYVDTKVSDLVDSAPATLNTLKELATALGDDANHVTTMTTLIGGKLPLTGGTMTGTIAGFSSTGINDNATSTAITIDSGEVTTFTQQIRVNGYINSYSDYNAHYYRKADGTTLGYTVFRDNGSNQYSYASGQDLRFYEGNVERFRLDSAGKANVYSAVTTYTGNLSESVSKAALLIKTHKTDSTVTTFGALSGGHGSIQRSNGPGTTFYSLALNPYGGNVGIGTSSPNDKLDVNGVVRARGLSINQPDEGGAPAITALAAIKGYEGRGAGITIQDSINSATNPGSQEWFVGSGYAQSAFNIGYSSTGVQSSYPAQNKLTITTAGNVGIGTSSPDAELHIEPSGSNASLLLSNNGRTQYWRIQNNEADDALVFNANDASERMRIDSSGNVGIGTSSPSGKLDIKGNFESSYALKFTNTMGTGKVSGFRSHGTNGESLSLYNDGRRMQMWQSDGTHIFESTSGSERMRITPTGSIGTGDWSGQFHQIRNVNNWHYASGGSYGPIYIHMKTNRRPDSENQMYSVTFRGHSYGQSKPINTSLCWYNYTPQDNTISVGSNGTHTASCYKSSDGYAVMTLYIPSHYYVAFTFDQFITNQRLRELTITNVIIHFGATGAY